MPWKSPAIFDTKEMRVAFYKQLLTDSVCF